jgi:thiosulfate/3-mercaptopyruvate sulfurtransferase
VRILDGGRQKWADEGRAFTSETPQQQPTDYKASDRDESIRTHRDAVRAQIGEQTKALVDVRSPQEYAGDLIAPPGYDQEGAQRAGHIPTAASIPWATAVRDDGTFKSADELRDLYGGKGITPDKEVTAYCRIGERSAHTWFVLRELLGFERVRNYDGSWTEWGNLVDVPIEKGADG